MTCRMRIRWGIESEVASAEFSVLSFSNPDTSNPKSDPSEIALIQSHVKGQTETKEKASAYNFSQIILIGDYLESFSTTYQIQIKN